MLSRLRDSEENHSWDEFTSLYRPAIYRFSRRFGLQDADADDATQKVLQSVAHAFEHRPPDLTGSRFRSWLSQVTRNTALKIIEREYRHRGTGDSSVQHLLNDITADSPEVEQTWLAEERQALYRLAAAEVRGNCTTTVWAAFEQTAVIGRSAEQVASELSISVGVVYASRSRILKRIRRIVEEYSRLSSGDRQ